MANKNIKGITIEVGGDTSKLQKSINQVNAPIYKLNNQLKDIDKALNFNTNSLSLWSQKQDLLSKNIELTKNKLQALKTAQKELGSYNNLTDQQKENYNRLSAEIAKTESALKGMIKQYQILPKLSLENLQNGLKKVGEISLEVSKKLMQVSGAVATALAGVVTAGVKSYADLEQNIGGINKIFGDSADKLIENAKNAYSTAGLSANQYMETATSFSASLIKSLGDDTGKATELTDRAIRDMSDNANTFGTSMDEVMNVYKALSKEQYTTLDNLRLGYAGTKEGMKQLIKDASKYKDVQKKLGVTVDENSMSFDNIINAISVMQDKMGIAGTTADEASGTITGSINSMKAAFDNFLNGSGSPEALSSTIVNVLKNIGDTIVELAPSILNGIVLLIQEILPKTIKLIVDTLPQLLNAVSDMIKSLLDMVKNNQEEISKTITVLINQIIEFLTTNLPLIVELGIEILLALTNGIIDSIPKLVDELPKVITAIFKTLWDNKGRIFTAGVDLIKALIEGIVSLTKKVGEEVGKIGDKIKEKFDGFKSKLKEVGKNLMNGLWEGLKEKWESLKGKVEDLGDGIVNKFRSVFGIKSPSKVFKKEIGQYLALGVETGFVDTMAKVSDKMTKAIPIDSLVSNYDTAMRGLSYGISNSANPIVNPNISKEQAFSSPLVIQIENFNNERETDIQSLAEELEYYRRNSAQARGGN